MDQILNETAEGIPKNTIQEAKQVMAMQQAETAKSVEYLLKLKRALDFTPNLLRRQLGLMLDAYFILTKGKKLSTLIIDKYKAERVYYDLGTKMLSIMKSMKNSWPSDANEQFLHDLDEIISSSERGLTAEKNNIDTTREMYELIYQKPFPPGITLF